MDPLTKLYVEITTRCNLSCQMCMQRAWNEPIGDMPLATFSSIVDNLSAFSTPPVIHLGGYGEPLFHPNFLEMVRLAKDAGAAVEVTTNGTLLTRDIAEALIDLGLDRMAVSIDGVTPERYEDIRVYASYQQVIENLRALFRMKLKKANRHSNPQVTIAFVAMKSNLADLANLPRLATRIGAAHIQVSNVIPHTAAMEQEILYERALTACAFRASPWLTDVSLPKIDLAGRVLDQVETLFDSRASLSLMRTSLSAQNDTCRFAHEGYAAVRWDGQVSPCLSLLHDHPEYIRGRRKQITHHTMGNVYEQPLSAIWESPEFVDFRARLRDFPFSPCTTCGGCERFPRNFEDCSENHFPVCGGCLWAQGFVACP
jgi:MoaA/NifB/PqqE/SkfB family radical SAM enzyme